jgi:hypothetical protein
MVKKDMQSIKYRENIVSIKEIQSTSILANNIVLFWNGGNMVFLVYICDGFACDFVCVLENPCEHEERKKRIHANMKIKCAIQQNLHAPN